MRGVGFPMIRAKSFRVRADSGNRPHRTITEYGVPAFFQRLRNDTESAKCGNEKRSAFSDHIQKRLDDGIRAPLDITEADQGTVKQDNISSTQSEGTKRFYDFNRFHNNSLS